MRNLLRNSIVVMSVLACLSASTVFASEQIAVSGQSGKTFPFAQVDSKKKETKDNNQTTNTYDNSNGQINQNENHTIERMM